MKAEKKRLTKRGLSDNNRGMDQREVEKNLEELRRHLRGAEAALEKLQTVERGLATPKG